MLPLLSKHTRLARASLPIMPYLHGFRPEKTVVAGKGGGGSERSLMRGLLRGIGALLGALLGGVTGCRSADAPPTPAALGLAPPGADGAYHASAHDLYNTFRVNAKGAARLLKDKTIQVTGRVILERSEIEPNPKRVKEGGRTDPDLFLYVHNPNPYDLLAAANGIECYFAASARPQLRRLVKTLHHGENGDGMVVIRGTFDTFSLGTVWLDECRLVAPLVPEIDEPKPTPETTPKPGTTQKSGKKRGQ